MYGNRGGWLLTHSIVFYLLGAKKIIATDYSRLAEPKYIKDAISNSYISCVRDILSPFEDHEVLRERLEHILSIREWNFDVLKKELNIEYVAPVDLTKRVLEPVDFIFSLSVLEHIIVDDFPVLVSNLAKMTKPNGNQFHFIHLEDHDNIEDDPFGFLANENYPVQYQYERGNRLRASSFQNEFQKHFIAKPEIVYEWRRKKPLPDRISKEISFIDEADAGISHMGLWIKN